MLKTIIVLPDGTELYSGVGETNNIRSVTVIQKVNSETELTLGSVCPTVLEATLQTPAGGLTIGEGTEITLYKEDDSGVRHKTGLFTMEKPQRSSANLYKLTAYDRISWLDKDLTDWLSALDGWPYTVLNFAHMVAGACGLTLKNTSLLNGGYQIRKFSGQGITGRKLMEWIGQICAKFCRAAPDGEIEFAWYENRYSITIAPSSFTQAGAGYGVAHSGGALSITSPAVAASGDGAVRVSGLAVVSDDGDGNLVLAVDDGQRTGIGYFQGGLSYEDYEVAPIEKVQIRLTEEDVGAVYPQVTGSVNTYTITGNYLLTNEDARTLQAVAEGVYNAIAHVRYTPCKVSVPANLHLRAGDTVRITDANGKCITAYIMTKTQKGQRDTFECTGSARRDSPEAVNSESLKSLSGKVLEVRKSIDGLNVKATRLDEKIEGNTKQLTEKITEVELDGEGITASVSSVQQQVVQNQNTVNQQIGEVSGKIDNVAGEASRNAEDIATVKESVTTLKQTSDAVSIQVQKIVDDGVSKVTTGMGYTFDENGLKIQKPGEEIGNLLDNTGMYVTRSGTVILQANAAGVTATDVKVNNYLIVGEHARFEDYSDGTDTKRTGCFWI